jgi:hypothetical protein
LVLRDSSQDEVTVTYTVMAKGHGTVFEGDAFTMPVEHVDIFDAAKFALEASHPDS